MLAVANFVGYAWVEPAFVLSWGVVAPALALELLLLRLHYLRAAVGPEGKARGGMLLY